MFALASATDARAADTDAPRGSGEVVSLSVVPITGRAEVVIAVDGSVDVQDFTLSKPARVVLDLKGAHLTMPARLYDKVQRGAIMNLRVAQYKEDIVRVVIDLDQSRDYSITRGEESIRVSIDAEAGDVQRLARDEAGGDGAGSRASRPRPAPTSDAARSPQHAVRGSPLGSAQFAVRSLRSRSSPASP